MSRQPRYPSDLTDAQCAVIEPLLPPASTGGRGAAERGGSSTPKASPARRRSGRTPGATARARRSTPRKRFILTDTLGLLIVVVVLAASVGRPRRRQAGPALRLLRRPAVPVRLRRRRFRWPAGGLGRPHPAHHRGGGPQTRRSTRVRGDPMAVGGGADLRLADRAPPAGPRLRASPGPLSKP
jgi:hypothetical protein